MTYLPVLLATACAGGVAAGASWPTLLVPALLAGTTAWAAAGWTWWAGRDRVLVPLAACGLVLFGGALGATAMRRAASPSIVRVLDAHGILAPNGRRSTVAVQLEGVLTADAAPSGRATMLRVAARRVWVGPCGCAEAVEGDVLITVAGESRAAALPSWRAGRLVSMVVTLRRPTSYRNPGAPDAERQAARRRLALVGSAKSALVVQVVGRGSWASETAAAIRAHARDAIARAAGPAHADAAAVGTAVLIGDRAGLSAALEDRLQRAGTFHVIAISGGNIAIWALLVVWFADRLTRRRSAAFVVTSLALVGYAGLVGGGASVLRATGMALVGIATRWLDQRSAAVNVLAVTGGLLVAADPLLVFDVGFWLTTAATAGLVLGLPAPRSEESHVGAWTRALVLTSVAAEAGLLPIVASVFQQVTLAGLAVSALAIPAMAAVQVSALVIVAADPLVPGLAQGAGAVLRAATVVVTESARLADMVPWLAWKVPAPSGAAIVVYYLTLAAWLWSRRWSADTHRAALIRRVAGIAAPLVAVWIAVSPATLVPSKPGALQVTAFDVGQGDAILIAFPNGRRMLVDAGGAMTDGRDLGARVVGPALRALGVRRLDYLVVTHPDLDHIGGAATIVREFQPREVWTGIQVAEHRPTRLLRDAAEEARAAWREVRRGERMSVAAVNLLVRHPEPPDWERQRVRNDDSLVLDLRYGGVRLLLTGDIGEAVESALVTSGLGAPDDRADLTVLKVAHHGSGGATSQAWLDALRPDMAIISAGPANPFGHPAPATLARLDAARSDVWRTDLDGAITLTTDGRAIDITSATGRKGRLVPR